MGQQRSTKFEIPVETAGYREKPALFCRAQPAQIRPFRPEFWTFSPLLAHPILWMCEPGFRRNVTNLSVPTFLYTSRLLESIEVLRGRPKIMSEWRLVFFSIRLKIKLYGIRRRRKIIKIWWFWKKWPSMIFVDQNNDLSKEITKIVARYLRTSFSTLCYVFAMMSRSRASMWRFLTPPPSRVPGAELFIARQKWGKACGVVLKRKNVG